MNAALSRLRRRTRRKEIALDDYLPQFRADGHHLVRPVVDWSADLEQCLADAQMQQLVRQAIEALLTQYEREPEPANTDDEVAMDGGAT